MRFLLRLTCITLVLCASAVLIMLAIGQHQPLSADLRMLHLTDCAPPCWIGITPGVTTMDEAKIRVQKTYRNAASFIYDMDGVTAVIKNPDDPHHPVTVAISALNYSNTAPVRGITFHFDNVQDHQFTLPALFSLIDEPSRIVYATVSAQETYYLSMDYKPHKPLGIEMAIDSANRRLEWSQHPRWLRFTTPLDLGGVADWRGFAAFVVDNYGRLR
jgi:hypothetical protein